MNIEGTRHRARFHTFHHYYVLQGQRHTSTSCREEKGREKTNVTQNGFFGQILDGEVDVTWWHIVIEVKTSFSN
ncbi:MAG: hypothetical protein A2992_05110 [Elusimicrobia bacterium RIFCSPLOWO2_01_FULL_59_12]|nr:MAG: hypothetical protein A2992_05110 [Elusimicrobia bacterium RIFCSPLOWO2_01_FULL_59_12]